MKPQDNAPPASNGPALLQLVSDHAIGNLLPVMALRPTKLVLVRHADKAAEAASTNLRGVISVLAQDPAFKGWQPKVTELALGSSTPDIAETRDLVARELVAHGGMIVNFTGGTKLMSIGAHLAASAFGRASFACDADALRWHDAHTGRHDRFPDLAGLTKHFTLRLLLAIQGRNLDEFRSEPASEPLRAYGLKAFELRNQHWNALDAFAKALRQQFATQNGRVAQEPDELRAVLSKPVAATGDPVRWLLTAAATAGLVKAEGQGWRLGVAPDRRLVERALHLLTHGWLELAVFDCLLRNPRYQHAQWNFESAKGHHEGGDPDIVCVDSKTGSLRLICCKVTLHRSPADHLEALAARVRKLGGGSALFVVYKPAQGQEALLRSEARRLGIDLALEADEIVKAFAPHAS